MGDSTAPNPGMPALQPPGAGLPWWELLAARYFIFPRACRRLSWEAAARLFQDEGAKILALWDALPVERLGERVLVRRLRGIEDSSRYWSTAMTVEHLVIVGRGIRATVRSLGRGEVPARVTRVEDVKPRGEAAPGDVRAQFVRLLTEAKAEEETGQPIPRGTGPRYAHPWFGPIDAYQWHCLLGIHQRLHRRQIEAIRDGLKQGQG
jgi:hypothetical protein